MIEKLRVIEASYIRWNISMYISSMEKEKNLEKTVPAKAFKQVLEILLHIKFEERGRRKDDGVGVGEGRRKFRTELESAEIPKVRMKSENFLWKDFQRSSLMIRLCFLAKE